MKTIVLGCAGIGEPRSVDGVPVGMFANLALSFPDRGQYDCRQFDWANCYGPVPLRLASLDEASYAVNVGRAAEAVVQEVRRLPAGSRTVLFGYSGGAQVVSAAAVALGPAIEGVITIANPLRALGDPRGPGSLAPTPPGFGAAGQHGPFAVPHFDLANPADGVPCCDQNSPIRTFFGLTEYFSLIDPVEWAEGLLSELVHRQQATELESVFDSGLRDWFDAIRDVEGFLYGGAHTEAYVPMIPEFAAEIASRIP